MNNLKKIYYYLFYKLYKWYERGPSVWLSDWKASLTLIVLEIWLLVSLLIYYKLLFNPGLDIVGTEFSWGLMVLILTTIDYFVFHYRSQWKEIVKDFDRIPRKKNRVGGWITFGIVVLIVANFIFSIYSYYQT